MAISLLELYGLKLNTSEQVYEPAEDTFLGIEALEKAITLSKSKNLKMLDMGCGTGIIGLYASSKPEISDVVLADINPVAVALAKENIQANSVEKAHAVESDLFSNIDGIFDILAFNAPYLREEQERNKDPYESLMVSGGEEGVEVSIKFIDEAEKHVHKGSLVIITASSLSNLDKLDEAIRKHGYVVSEKLARHYFFEDIIAMILRKT
ncbi:MAG: HemK2/MTQ2 family protein methyltransferase [Candidatus Micrarchaeia archaeon]